MQHYLFCPRQCALIHVEQVWAEDGATAEGRIMHDRVDNGPPDRRAGVRTVRGMAIRSMALGVAGKADAVEFHGKGADAVPYPVEYKRGRPKAHRADEVQLCAQAICLEEMFGVSVPEGALFYGETRRRFVVDFDAELRSLTAGTAQSARAMIAAAITPSPHYQLSCKHCSLQDLCVPRSLEKPPSVSAWLARQLNASLGQD
ncbi:CRISPR-associated exonuclease Cas4 [Novosphingobium sediminicola]|uniref:CRISPR-associated exonuclease Cas4 n=1 Tax=Novosphingobium sediminicola TaxID=563162 RepID=A0A7W6CN67_9SPHN|nr:CRISPR-associated exonuclease Cas4 [Novosphingobium sediminicola]